MFVEASENDCRLICGNTAYAEAVQGYDPDNLACKRWRSHPAQ